MAKVTGNIDILISALNETSDEFRGAEADIKKLADAREYANKVVLEEYRAKQLLGQVYRAQNQVYYDTFQAMQQIGSIGQQLISISNARSIAELRVSDSLGNVYDAEARLAIARALYGEDSYQYKQSLEDLEDAQTGYNRALKEQESQALNSGLALVGVVGTMGNLLLQLKERETLTAWGDEFLSVIAMIDLGIAGLALALGLLMVGLFAALEVSAPGDTPTAMSGLLGGEFELTKDEMLDGVTYEDKYGDWRDDQIRDQEADKMGGIDAPIGGAERAWNAEQERQAKEIKEGRERSLYLSTAREQAEAMGFDAGASDTREQRQQANATGGAKVVNQTNNFTIEKVEKTADIDEVAALIAASAREAARGAL